MREFPCSLTGVWLTPAGRALIVDLKNKTGHDRRASSWRYFPGIPRYCASMKYRAPFSFCARDCGFQEAASSQENAVYVASPSSGECNIGPLNKSALYALQEEGYEVAG